jgi:RNA polymerase sigma-70 factor (ECF subfamily)
MRQTKSSPQARGLHELRAQSDEALFLASQAGDELAFRTLVERHVHLIQRLALNVVRDEIEAEDVAQEAFVSAWRNRHNWRPEARFTTWLYRIAMNKAIDRYRSRRAAPHAQEVITQIIDREVSLAETPEQHGGLERRQVSSTLLSALDSLPASQSTALKLFYFEDMEVVKIAAAMNTTEQSVRALLKRGRQALKLRLAAPGAVRLRTPARPAGPPRAVRRRPAALDSNA